MKVYVCLGITSSTPIKRSENLPDFSAIVESQVLPARKEPALQIDSSLEMDVDSSPPELHGR